MGEIVVRNRNLLGTFAGIALALFLATRALAQTPIEGWDKAKFGMSPEQLREAYSEEEEYYKDTYYQKLDYIEKRHAEDADREHHQMSPEEYKEFWEEKKECWSRENGGVGYPQSLQNSWMKVLSRDIEPWYQRPIIFNFVDNKLFSVRIRLEAGKIEIFLGVSKEEVEARHKTNLELSKLKKALIKKYGDSFKEDGIEEESEKVVPSVPSLFKSPMESEPPIPMVVKRERLVWVDVEGNILVLESHFERFCYKETTYNLFLHCEIDYFDRELMELWQRKQAHWRKEVAQWEKRGEELGTKGVDSF